METETTRTSERAEIREYLRPLLRRWWLILGMSVAVGAITYVHAAGQPPRYTSSTVMLVAPSSYNSVFTGQVNFGGDPDRIAKNQATLVQSEDVAKRVAKRLGFRGNPRALLNAITVVPVEETDFLKISATASSPRVAAAIANAFARAYKEVNASETRTEAQKAIAAARRQMDKLPPGSNQYESLNSKIERLEILRALPTSDVRQLDPARPPTVAEGADPVQNAAFGFAVALLLAGGAAYALEMLDRRIRRANDIEPLYGHSVLAELPHARDATSSIDGRLALPRALTEGFRGLRTNLQLEAHLGRDELRTMLVASAIAGEGKSTIVRNLAIAYRESGVSVAVIDADLRNPTLSRLIAEDPQPGLLEVLTGAASLDEALRPVELHVAGLATISRVQQAMQQMRERQAASVPAAAPDPIRSAGSGGLAPAPSSAPPAPWLPNLSAPSTGTSNGNGNGNASEGRLALLPSGATPADPGAVLASRRFQVLLKEVAERYDIVLIDSSPLLPVSDTRPLLSIVDGVVLTSRVGVTTRSAGRQVVTAVSRVPGAKILGVVANDVKPSEGSQHYGYGYGQYGSSGQNSRGG